MCTAVTFLSGDFYMGRTLDYERSYGEQIAVMPRQAPLAFRHGGTLTRHYAMLGTAHMAGEYPLYYDAVNEKGLGMAGLNFVGNAVYAAVRPERRNIAQFELIPWVLSQCADVREARALLAWTNLVGTAFSEALPAAQLHWLLADRSGAVVLETAAEGMKLYENPAGVLTNNPPFPVQLFQLNNYMQLSERPPENRFSDALRLTAYSRGMGAMGLPGDLSSMSRFVRAAFTRLHARGGTDEAENVSQVLHILGSVEQTDGCCQVAPEAYERTIYTACWNATRGVYYYTGYHRHRISAVELWNENPDGTRVVCYPMLCGEDVFYQNRTE